MKHMVRIRKRRLEDDGKMTEFSLCKRPVPDARIDRFVQRSGFGAIMMMSKSPMVGKTPPAIDYKTPSVCSSNAGTPAAPREHEALTPPYLGCQLDGMATLNLDFMQGLGTSPKNSLNTLYLSPRLQVSAGYFITSDTQEMPARVPLSVDISRESMPNQPDGVSRQYQATCEEYEPEEQYQTEPSDENQDFPVGMHWLGRQLTLNERQSEQIDSTETRDCQLSGGEDLSIVTKKTFERSITRLIDHALSQPCNHAKLGGHLRAAASRGDRQTVQRILHVSKNAVHEHSLGGEFGRTALHNAAFAGYCDIVKDLLQAGADPCLEWLDNKKVFGFESMSALDLAVLSGNVNSVGVLITSLSTVHRSERPVSVMMKGAKIAMHKKKLACLERLVKCVYQQRNSQWDDIVLNAVAKYHFKGLRALVRREIDIIPSSSRAINGSSPNLHEPLSLSTLKGVLHSGLDINLEDNWGFTLLHSTILSGTWSFDCEDSFRLAERLLVSGADPNTQNELGTTPLHSACSSSTHNEKIVGLLLDSGADPSIRDLYGRTPLHMACSFRSSARVRYAKLLLDCGADPNICDWVGRTPLHMAALAKGDGLMTTLIQAGAYFKMLDRKGSQLLNYILIHSFLPVIREVEQGGPHPYDFLFRSGLMINARDNEGNGVMHYAAVFPCLRRLLPPLLHAGIDPNAQNLLGETPLHTILRSSPQLHEVEVLLNNGARLDMRNNRDETAVHVAISYWTTVSSDIFKVLLEKQPDVFHQQWRERSPFVLSLENASSLPQPYTQNTMGLLSLFCRFRRHMNHENTGVDSLTDLSAGTGYRCSHGNRLFADDIILDDAAVNGSLVNDSASNDFVDNDSVDKESVEKEPVECSSAVCEKMDINFHLLRSIWVWD